MRPLALPIFFVFCCLSAPMFGAPTASPALPQEVRAKLDWLSEASIAVSKPVLIMVRHCQTPGRVDAQDFSLLNQLLDTFVVEEVLPRYESELLKPERRAEITKKLALFSLGIVQQGKAEKIQPLAASRRAIVPPDPFQGALVPFEDRKLGIAFQYRPSGWILYQEGAALGLFPKESIVRNRYSGLAILTIPQIHKAFGTNQEEAARKVLEAIGGFGQGVPVVPVSGESKLAGFEVRAPETRQDDLAWGEVLFRKDGDSAIVIVGRAHKDRFMAFKRIFEETGRSLTFGGEAK